MPALLTLHGTNGGIFIRTALLRAMHIPRPIEGADREDGGPLAYRVAHKVKLWKPGAAPRLERTSQEGTLPLVV